MGKFEDYVLTKNIEVHKNYQVTNIKKIKDYFKVTYINKENETFDLETKNIFFSNPLLEFINIYEEEVPDEVIKSAGS